MLAAESARAVLSAEQAKIRELLTQIDEAVQAGGCASAVQAQALLDLIGRLQAFDEGTHRPKGVMLLSTLRGRSTEVDAALQRVTAMRERCETLLSEIRAQLEAVQDGKMGAAAWLEALLEEHRMMMLAHLEAEESLLYSLSAEHLTPDEWAAIASAISKVIRAGGKRR